MNTFMPVARRLPQRRTPRNPRMLRALQISGLTLALTALAGCDSGHQDLQTWMDETRQATPTVVEKVSEPKRFEPFRYRASDQVDPFSLGRLRIMVASASSSSGASLQPDLARRREALEAFPLDTLRMVGTVKLKGRLYGLVQTNDGLVHRVLPGNHLGQSDGRITAIEEGKISLTEIVPDGMGGFIERPAALALSE